MYAVDTADAGPILAIPDAAPPLDAMVIDAASTDLPRPALTINATYAVCRIMLLSVELPLICCGCATMVYVTVTVPTG